MLVLGDSDIIRSLPAGDQPAAWTLLDSCHAPLHYIAASKRPVGTVLLRIHYTMQW